MMGDLNISEMKGKTPAIGISVILVIDVFYEAFVEVLFPGFLRIIEALFTIVLTAIFGIIGTIFVYGTEQFLFFRPPGNIEALHSIWFVSSVIFFSGLTIAGGAFFLASELFPQKEETDPMRFIERAIIAVIALLVCSPIIASTPVDILGYSGATDLYSVAVLIVNGVGEAIFPDTYTISFMGQGIGTLAGYISAFIGSAVSIIILAILWKFFALAILLMVMLFYGVLAMRMLLIYTVYAALPVLLLLWIVDVGPGKYGNMIASIVFKLTAMLLLFGIIIAGILGTTSAIAGQEVATAGDNVSQFAGGDTEIGNPDTSRNPFNKGEDGQIQVNGSQTDLGTQYGSTKRIPIKDVEPGMSIQSALYSGIVEDITVVSGGAYYSITYASGRAELLNNGVVVTVVEENRNTAGNSGEPPDQPDLGPTSTGSVDDSGTGFTTGTSSSGSLQTDGTAPGGVGVMLQFFAWFGGIILCIALTMSSMGMLVSARTPSSVKSRARQGRSGDAPTGGQVFGGSGSDSGEGGDIPTREARGKWENIGGKSAAPDPPTNDEARDIKNNSFDEDSLLSDEDISSDPETGTSSASDSSSTQDTRSSAASVSTSSTESRRTASNTSSSETEGGTTPGSPVRAPNEAQISHDGDNMYVETDDRKVRIGEDGVEEIDPDEQTPDAVPLTEKGRYVAGKTGESIDDATGAGIMDAKNMLVSTTKQTKAQWEEFSDDVAKKGDYYGDSFEDYSRVVGESLGDAFEEKIGSGTEDSPISDHVDPDRMSTDSDSIMTDKVGELGNTALSTTGSKVGEMGNAAFTTGSKGLQGLNKVGNLTKRGSKAYWDVFKQPTTAESIDEAGRIMRESPIAKPTPTEQQNDWETNGTNHSNTSDTKMEWNGLNNDRASEGFNAMFTDGKMSDGPESAEEWSSTIPAGKTEVKSDHGRLGNHEYHEYGSKISMRTDAPMEQLNTDAAQNIEQNADQVGITGYMTQREGDNDKIGAYGVVDGTSNTKFSNSQGNTDIGSGVKNIDNADYQHEPDGQDKVVLTEESTVSEASDKDAGEFRYNN